MTTTANLLSNLLVPTPGATGPAERSAQTAPTIPGGEPGAFAAMLWCLLPHSQAPHTPGATDSGGSARRGSGAEAMAPIAVVAPDVRQAAITAVAQPAGPEHTKAQTMFLDQLPDGPAVATSPPAAQMQATRPPVEMAVSPAMWHVPAAAIARDQPAMSPEAAVLSAAPTEVRTAVIAAQAGQSPAESTAAVVAVALSPDLVPASPPRTTMTPVADETMARTAVLGVELAAPRPAPVPVASSTPRASASQRVTEVAPFAQARMLAPVAPQVVASAGKQSVPTTDRIVPTPMDAERAPTPVSVRLTGALPGVQRTSGDLGARPLGTDTPSSSAPTPGAAEAFEQIAPTAGAVTRRDAAATEPAIATPAVRIAVAEPPAVEVMPPAGTPKPLRTTATAAVTSPAQVSAPVVAQAAAVAPTRPAQPTPARTGTSAAPQQRTTAPVTAPLATTPGPAPVAGETQVAPLESTDPARPTAAPPAIETSAPPVSAISLPDQPVLPANPSGPVAPRSEPGTVAFAGGRQQKAAASGPEPVAHGTDSLPVRFSPVEVGVLVAASAEPPLDEVSASSPRIELVRAPELDPARLSEAGAQRLRLQIEPPELGGCEIELVLRPEGLHATVIAERPETAVALRDAEPLIRQTLAQRGLELTGFQVGSGSGQTPGQAFGQPESPALPPATARPSDGRTDTPTPQLTRRHEGRVNLVA